MSSPSIWPLWPIYLISKKLPKVNSHPKDEKSHNLVTLLKACFYIGTTVDRESFLFSEAPLMSHFVPFPPK
jgi:hypothetical protein